MLCFDFKKRHIKGEKHIAAMDFAEFLRKSNVPQKSNFIMADYYAVDFTEFIVIFVKVDEMYSILKSLLAIRYWLRDEGGIGWSKLLLEPSLQCLYIFYIKG